MTLLNTLLAVLSHPARRRALRMLQGGSELCLCQLMAEAGVSQPSMSRHMSALKDAGLVLDRRDAQWVRYRRVFLTSESLERVVGAVLDADNARSSEDHEEIAA